MTSLVRLRPLPLLRRLHAAAFAGLVVALMVFAAAPRLHEWLHGAGGDHGADRCAVVLFASGVTLVSGAIPVAPPRAHEESRIVVAYAAADWTSPRFLLLPGRAPPAR